MGVFVGFDTVDIHKATSIEKLIVRLFIIRPHLALAHDCFKRIVHAFGRVLMLFQQTLDHFPHGGTSRLFLLPVNGSVFVQRLG